MTPTATCLAAVALLLDASGSARHEWRRQVEAHADALVAPAVTGAVEGSGGVAVAVWSIGDRPRRRLGWRMLSSAADVAQLAREVAALPPPDGMESTATGETVLAALDSLAAAPACERALIDVVTDGESNVGIVVEAARDAAEAAGVRINALVIRTQNSDPEGWARERLVTAGGFVLAADGWEDVARALRAKLIREVAER